ncbi:hypothetical protein L2X98_34855 [Microbacterium elymi]|uniref:Uncharacterized protein n=1 Tax=Microbacterium elymi TaxID=2909587 RepID=A0ABY5NJJ1_9MICO|nr:hypothetical protein L2X98_34855 [Microbacterium elymi]
MLRDTARARTRVELTDQIGLAAPPGIAIDDVVVQRKSGVQQFECGRDRIGGLWPVEPSSRAVCSTSAGRMRLPPRLALRRAAHNATKCSPWSLASVSFSSKNRCKPLIDPGKVKHGVRSAHAGLPRVTEDGSRVIQHHLDVIAHDCLQSLARLEGSLACIDFVSTMQIWPVAEGAIRSRRIAWSTRA